LLHFLASPRPPLPTPCPYTTLFRSRGCRADEELADLARAQVRHGLLSVDHLPDRALRVGEQSTSRVGERHPARASDEQVDAELPDRKSTRLNSSHQIISYAVFCLKK